MYSSTRRHRLSIRLRTYDYRWPGLYFVTVCTQQRRCLLGEIKNGAMTRNNAGDLVAGCLSHLPERFTGLKVDTSMLMPNHVHAIFGVGPSLVPFSLGSVVRYWKAASCRFVRAGADPSFGWQRNYYERVIRNEEEADRIRRYIRDNPLQWERDEENPANH